MTVRATRYLVGAAVIILMFLTRETQAQLLTLEQAVAIAKEQSPTAQVVRQQVAQASARTGQATAMFLPMIRLTSTYSVSDNAVQVFMYGLNQGKFSMAGDFNNPPTADNWQLSLQAQYRLFSGGRDMANRSAARAAQQAVSRMGEATNDELTIQVIRAYLAVLTTREMVRASEAAFEAVQAGERVMASRVDAGTALKTNLLEIQVHLAQTEERLLAARNGLALAKESLRQIMGLDSLPYSDFGRLDDLNLVTPAESESGERPELLARVAMAAAARSEHRASKGGYLPAISAFASADRYQGREFNGTNESWTAGLMLEWSLFDGFLTPSQVKEKRAAARMAEQEERAARLQMSVARFSAESSYRNAIERVGVMQRAATLAAENATLTRLRFEQGLMLSSQLIDAETALVQAEVGLAQAKADRLIALAEHRRALGISII